MAQPTNDDLDKNDPETLDDLFKSENDDDKTIDPFGNFSNATDDTEIPFPGSSELAQVNSEFSDLNDLNDLNMSKENEVVEPVLDKKGKKAKASKVKKEKKIEITKVKQEKARSPRFKTPRVPGDLAIGVLACFLLALLVIGNAVAFLSYGMSALFFMIIYSILCVIALSVPFFFWKKRNTGEFLNLYDVLLGCALIFVVLACMIVLIAQSQKYGSNIKGTAKAISVQNIG
ncbi:MAG: hypothetical protein Q4C95_09790 [Planctomycetia bacterium]|nr:hypothetical protein [Planctomycetia bacterium]